jgi:hypothetical protein
MRCVVSLVLLLAIWLVCPGRLGLALVEYLPAPNFFGAVAHTLFLLLSGSSDLWVLMLEGIGVYTYAGRLISDWMPQSAT